MAYGAKDVSKKSINQSKCRAAGEEVKIPDTCQRVDLTVLFIPLHVKCFHHFGGGVGGGGGSGGDGDGCGGVVMMLLI